MSKMVYNIVRIFYYYNLKYEGITMGTLQLIENYFWNKTYRKSFNDLAQATFGLDFEVWYQKRYFKGKYKSYAYAIDEEIIANVSANEMHVVINGEEKRAIQIGTVMTREDCRGNGLATRLMNHVINIYEDQCDFIYLFANKTALEFYPKFGFKPIMEKSYRLKAEDIRKQESMIIELQSGTHFTDRLIERLINNRTPISNKWGIVQDNWPLEVYCKDGFKDNLYYIKDEDIMIIAIREAKVLHLYDVISSKPFVLDDLLERIVIQEDEEIEFHFIPELVRYIPISTRIKREDDTLFIRGLTLTESQDVLFPMTSHT